MNKKIIYAVFIGVAIVGTFFSVLAYHDYTVKEQQKAILVEYCNELDRIVDEFIPLSSQAGLYSKIMFNVNCYKKYDIPSEYYSDLSNPDSEITRYWKEQYEKKLEELDKAKRAQEARQVLGSGGTFSGWPEEKP